MKIPRRFEILRHILTRRPPEWSLEWSGVARYLLQSSPVRRGEPYIAETSQDNGWVKVRLKGVERPLIFKNSLPWPVFCMVVHEVFDDRHWHYYQIPETRVEAGDVVVDCGAAEGLFTLVASQSARRTIAVEPLPDFIEGLQRSFTGDESVHIIPLAAGSRSGTVRFAGDTVASAVSAAGTIDVRVEPLDAILGDDVETVTYLKADVEGGEYDLLRGAAETISRARPRLVVTVYHDPNDYQAIMKFIRHVRPDYRFRLKGLAGNGHPVVLHAW